MSSGLKSHQDQVQEIFFLVSDYYFFFEQDGFYKYLSEK